MAGLALGAAAQRSLSAKAVLTASMVLLGALACGRERSPAGVASAPSGTACIGPGALPSKRGARNIEAEPLMPCPSRHRTGFYRDGYCNTGADDHGVHVVCAKVTSEFLRFSATRGNDLVTPREGFPGLHEGDHWCLCAARWQEALEAGVAPPVVVEATDETALMTLKKPDLLGRALAAQ